MMSLAEPRGSYQGTWMRSGTYKKKKTFASLRGILSLHLWQAPCLFTVDGSSWRLPNQRLSGLNGLRPKHFGCTAFSFGGSPRCGASFGRERSDALIQRLLSSAMETLTTTAGYDTTGMAPATGTGVSVNLGRDQVSLHYTGT
jgi:hypothetical protein